MSFRESTHSWARKNSGLISIAGALIIFFSWVLTNTLGGRYSRVKATIESAQERFRLHVAFLEQRNRIDSLRLEMLLLRTEMGKITPAEPQSREKVMPIDIGPALSAYEYVQRRAQKFRDMNAFLDEAHSLSGYLRKPLAITPEIEAYSVKLRSVVRSLSKYESEVEEAVRGLDPSGIIRAIQTYKSYYSAEAEGLKAMLPERIRDLRVNLEKEARQYLSVAKKRAEYAQTVSLFLYIVGSCLALSGQAIAKVKGKEEQNKQRSS